MFDQVIERLDLESVVENPAMVGLCTVPVKSIFPEKCTWTIQERAQPY
jgi:hypothetical protein